MEFSATSSLVGECGETSVSLTAVPDTRPLKGTMLPEEREFLSLLEVAEGWVGVAVGVAKTLEEVV